MKFESGSIFELVHDKHDVFLHLQDNNEDMHFVPRQGLKFLLVKKMSPYWWEVLIWGKLGMIHIYTLQQNCRVLE